MRNKWLIFDAVAVIYLLNNEQKYILDELKKEKVEFLYIHPVLLELMATNNPSDKVERAKLLIDYDFTELNLTRNEIKLAYRIQKSLPLKCQPSPTDLYLGGTLGSHTSNTYLVTANIKDFPMPVYTRHGHIIVQSNNNLSTLTILSLDDTKLV